MSIQELKCSYGCPNKTSLTLLKNGIRPIIDSLYNDKTKTFRKVLHEQNDLNYGYDIFGGVFTLCNRDILMVDFDNKDGFTTELAIEYIKDYTNKMYNKHKYDMLFELYETDRGVHAFLVNRLIDFTSKDAIRIMIDLCSDPMYIGYTEVRGFCIRLSPKIKNSSDIKKTVDNEFTTRAITGVNFRIGYGTILEYVDKILKSHIEMTELLTSLYRTELTEFTSKTYISESDSYDIYPSNNIFNFINNSFKNILSKYNLYSTGTVFKNSFRRNKNYNIKIYEQNNLELYYNISNNKFFLCSPEILKISIETAPHNKLKIINILKNEFYHFSFNVYDSKKYLIIYLVSHYKNYFNNHVFNSFVGRYCINIFFSEYCEELMKPDYYFVKIGSVINDQNIDIIFNIKDNLTDLIKELYTENLIVEETRYIEQIYSNATLPSEDIFEYIRECTIDILENNSFVSDENTTGVFINTKLLNASRYEDLFDPEYKNKNYGNNALDEYSRRSVVLVNKSDKYANNIFRDQIPFYGIDHWIKNILGPYLINKSYLQVTLLNGPLYPFILGFDNDKKMVYIRFFDILMLDWDTHDGIPKTSPVMIIDRFLRWQDNINENDRIAKNKLCFKFYETDNGVHAYCVSHRLPYFNNNSSVCMVHSATDFAYSTMARFYGYSIRLSPKIYSSEFQLKSDEQISEQFIQSEGIPCEYIDKLQNNTLNEDSKVFYIGNIDKIDPYLDEMTNFVFKIQNFVKSQENIKDSIQTGDVYFLEAIRNYALNEYNNTIRYNLDGRNSKENMLWATGSNSYNYNKNNLTDIES